MSAQMEQVIFRSVAVRKPLCLPDRFESSHATCFEKPLEETASCFGVSSRLQISIDDYAILIDSAPKAVLYTANP